MELKKIIVLIVAMIAMGRSYSQSDFDLSPEDHEKYLFYRQRLWDKFLRKDKFGLTDLQNGDHNVKPDKFCIPYSHLEVKTPASANSHWDDDKYVLRDDYAYRGEPAEPGINLGWYIAVLATEFKLLREAGEPTQEVKKELYYAMRQYESLDRRAERFVGFQDGPIPAENGINGVFMRGFDEHMPHTDDPKACINFNSGDQMSGLILGFAMVKKCLEGTGEKYFGDEAHPNGYDYVIAAKAYAHSMGKWMDHFDFRPEVTSADGSERITPDECSNFRMRGVLGEGNAFLMARAIQWITGVNYFDKNCIEREFVNPLSWFGNLFNVEPTISVEIVCEEIQETVLRVQSHSYNNMEALKVYWLNRNDFPIGYKSAYQAVGGDNGSGFKLEQASDQFLMHLYYGIHNFLHNKPVSYNHQIHDYYLIKNADPEGVMFKPLDKPNNATKYWKANRYERPLSGLELNENDYWHAPGLDFMLLYNIYRLHYNNVSETENLSSNPVPTNVGFIETRHFGPSSDDIEIVGIDVPTIVETNTHFEKIGYESIPNDVSAHNLITSTETLSGQINRGYYAGEIDLQPGFEANHGVTFCAMPTNNKYTKGIDYMNGVDFSASITNSEDYFPTTELNQIRYNREASKTTEIENVIASRNIISPNPAQDFFNLISEDEESDISIFDLKGKLILQKKVFGKVNRIETLNFLSGVYIVQVKGQHSSMNKKLIVQ